MSGLCRHCRMGESDHHAFEAIRPPPGCVCDPASWDYLLTTIPASCAAYVAPPRNGSPGREDYCATCEHERRCHAKAQP
jgi:hypothetical protein